VEVAKGAVEAATYNDSGNNVRRSKMNYGVRKLRIIT